MERGLNIARDNARRQSSAQLDNFANGLYMCTSRLAFDLHSETRWRSRSKSKKKNNSLVSQMLAQFTIITDW